MDVWSPHIQYAKIAYLRAFIFNYLNFNYPDYIQSISNLIARYHDHICEQIQTYLYDVDNIVASDKSNIAKAEQIENLRAKLQEYRCKLLLLHNSRRDFLNKANLLHQQLQEAKRNILHDLMNDLKNSRDFIDTDELLIQLRPRLQTIKEHILAPLRNQFDIIQNTPIL